MKRLIFNADDYGRWPDISRGIREAHLRGVVTSTTCMMHMPNTAADIAVALKETPSLRMGIHLVLTMGKPILPREAVPSLVDEDGNFFKYTPFIEHIPSLNLDEVKAEWHAQVEAFIKAAGRKPTHLDSHHHSACFSAGLFRAMLELAKEYDCAIRFPFTDKIMDELEETSKQVPELIEEFNPPRPDHFIFDFYDKNATYEMLLNILNNLQDGTTEIMCHPGHIPDAFLKESIYNRQREREFSILTDPSIKEAIRTNGIELISFADL